MSLLAGVRVLDLTMWRPGPYATQLLAQLGADVLKVEPPGGEPMRAFRSHFDLLNQRKRSVVLDLKSAEGRARCLELAAAAEVFVEGFRPGVADRLGVGPEAAREANPALVYCSLSGYGAEGPLADVPGHDINYRAHAAALAPDALSPAADELPVADMSAATMAAFAITAGVLHARVTGEGERIDLGMADVMAHWVATVPQATRTPPPTAESHRVGPVPGYGVYRTKDGRGITLGVVSEDRLWAAVCRALDLPDLAELGFADRLGRVRELDEAVAAAVARLRADEAVVRLAAEGAPVAPILSRAEMMAHPHFAARGVVADGGLGSPVRTTAAKPLPPGKVPELDEHRGQSWLE
ncbi:CaiB/BaiF CoA transferase family protein [Actinomadura rupiterrae]|uniref:CaiB/BaiF CoA transferase family protein n=1 Tax=Actinomadura rupiterrae TaxID=559627 RepID=UPI0020A37CE4|nr:CoA transferase [Actinomadura rupiterrae]MCP2337093.1 crotonobetainyl-CoA:carnitine CoA-transferase CaiB-like acyl-CoA transferase [Actinomadura rupiterrae]